MWTLVRVRCPEQRAVLTVDGDPILKKGRSDVETIGMEKAEANRLWSLRQAVALLLLLPCAYIIWVAIDAVADSSATNGESDTIETSAPVSLPDIEVIAFTVTALTDEDITITQFECLTDAFADDRRLLDAVLFDKTVADTGYSADELAGAAVSVWGKCLDTHLMAARYTNSAIQDWVLTGYESESTGQYFSCVENWLSSLEASDLPAFFEAHYVDGTRFKEDPTHGTCTSPTPL